MTQFLTVFTPTYNRAYTLPQLYESLCRQTCQDFVWSIVDDGSTDNTEELVRQWIEGQRIPIIYHKQPNGGKMRAHNYGARICTTPLFVCIDSDDYVSDFFVESVQTHYPQIKESSNLVGFIAYRAIRQKDGAFRVICHFPCSGTTTLKDIYKKGFHGDTTIVFKSDILRKYPFLEVEGEKFSSEDYAYCQIDQKYKYLLVKEAWTMCTYLPDGYSYGENALWAKNPKGSALYYNLKVKFTDGYLNKEKIGCAIKYMIYARRAGMKGIWRQSELKTPFYPLIWFLSYYYERKWKQKFPK